MLNMELVTVEAMVLHVTAISTAEVVTLLMVITDVVVPLNKGQWGVMLVSTTTATTSITSVSSVSSH